MPRGNTPKNGCRVSERHSRKKKETNEHYLPLFELQRKQYEAELVRIETEYAAATDRIGRQRTAEGKAEEETYTALRAKTERRLDAELASVEEDYSKKRSAAAAERDDAWARMAAKWMDVTAKVAQTFSELRNEGAELFPPWNQVRAGGARTGGSTLRRVSRRSQGPARWPPGRFAARAAARAIRPGAGLPPLPRPLLGAAPRPRRGPGRGGAARSRR